MDADILIVDDEKEIADMIAFYLRNDGYTVHVCYSPQDALALIEQKEMDLALLDVMMPEMDGFELCRRIREKYSYPIIMLTARDAEIDKITGFSLGADDYVTKPFLPLELAARVKANVRRYKKYEKGDKPVGFASGEQLVCGDIILDVAAHCCHVQDTSVSLTPSEFSILQTLMEQKGNVVNAEDLFHSVWKEEYYSKNNNTITVHIRHLREKLEDNPENPQRIKTVWGVGYRIHEV